MIDLKVELDILTCITNTDNDDFTISTQPDK